MEAVIERLRASKQKRENKDRVAGHKAGRDWATMSAEFDTLERVALCLPAGVGPALKDDGRLRRHVVAALAGNEDWDLENEDAFWEDVAGHRAPSDDFVLGFLEGAEEVWFEVADKL